MTAAKLFTVVHCPFSIFDTQNLHMMLRSIYVVMLTSTDPSEYRPQSSTNDADDLQTLCTRNFVTDLFPGSATSYDICAYPGTACDEGALINLSWKNSNNIAVKSLNWIPPTVEKMSLVEVTVTDPFDARALPRSLQYFRATYCYLKGTMDPSALPDGIVQIHLRKNYLSGTLSLLNLPPNLIVIDMARNRVEKVFYDIERLPNDFRAAYLYNSDKKKIPAKNVGTMKDVRGLVHLQGWAGEKNTEWAEILHRHLKDGIPTIGRRKGAMKLL